MVGYIGINMPVVEESLTNIIDSGSINNTTSGWTKSNSTAITLTQGTDYVTYTVSKATTAEIYKTFSLGTYTYTTDTSTTYSYIATEEFWVSNSTPSFNSTTGYFNCTTYLRFCAISSSGASNALGEYFIPVDGAPPTSNSTSTYGPVYYRITAATYGIYNGAYGIKLTLQATESSLKTDKQILYAQAKVKSSSSNSSYPIRYIRRYLNGSYDAYRLQAIDGTAETALNDNQWHTSSAYLETYDGTNGASYDRMCLQFNSAVVNDTFDFKDILVVNLTSAFGSGNEPSKLECDQNIYIENNSIVYRSPESIAREIKNMYIGVGEVAHKVKKAYIGINNIARLWYVSAGEHISYYGTTTDTLYDSIQYPGAGHVGNYALIAGGKNSSTSQSNYGSQYATPYNSSLVRQSSVLIYNEGGYQWVSTNVGNYVIFAAGTRIDTSVQYYNSSLITSTIGIFDYSGSTGRSYVGVASVGNYALFAGGYGYYSSYRCYNTLFTINSSLSTTTSLTISGPRQEVCGGSIGNYALFLGGKGTSSSDYYSTVDVFSSSLVKSSVSSADIPAGIYVSANTSNHLVFVRKEKYSGGTIETGDSNYAFAYNSSLVKSIIPPLSVYRTNFSGVSLSSCAIFAGGNNTSTGKVVECYNSSLELSRLTDLSVYRYIPGATSIGNYALIAGGGQSYSNTVDIYVLEE